MSRKGYPVSHATLGRSDLFMPSASETRAVFLTEQEIQTPIARLKEFPPDARNATPDEAGEDTIRQEDSEA